MAMAVLLLGAVGLAIDGSQLYAQRQMAQAAADAAAQAAIRSIYVGSNVSSNTGYFSTTAGATCAASDSKTPCYYAQTMNGFNGASDTVSYDFPSASTVGVPSGVLSANPTYPVYLVRVIVQRQVQTTLFKFISASNATVMAQATGAIVAVQAPVPILVTHPTISGSFNLGGSGNGPKITICGGPSRSIQVNSSSATSMTWNGNPVVNLAHAGPPDPGDCTTGNGADFGDFGGPSNGGSIVTFGTVGQFVNPAPPIPDPLGNVSAPTLPSPLTWPTNAKQPLSAGSNGCPTGSGGCTLYFPGYWTQDIKVKNLNAVFAPGIYYMYGSNFIMDSNSEVFMSQGLSDTMVTTSPSVGTCCGTGQSTALVSWGGTGSANGNMLMYFTGPGSPASTGAITIGSNAGCAGCFLQGAPNSSSYLGILFFVDRNAAANTYSLDGGATVTLTGTIYTNNSLSVMNANAAQYQTLKFQGNGSSTTVLVGEIITNALSLQGTPGIKMDLNSQVAYTVDQVALVQ